MIAAGLEALDWLAAVHCYGEKSHFVPIGSHGFYSKSTGRARFDQQPIEASAAVSASLQAYRATGEARWRKEAWRAFNWFLESISLQYLYRSSTGGCRDGLHPDRANQEEPGCRIHAVFSNGAPGNAQVGKYSRYNKPRPILNRFPDLQGCEKVR